MNTFGFIGVGNMGKAMLNGVLRVYNPNQVMITDASETVSYTHPSPRDCS